MTEPGTDNERSQSCPSTMGYFGTRPSKSVDAIDFGPKVEQRFWAKVEASADGCWNWTGSRNWKGYGFFKVTNPPPEAGLSVGAHRIAYLMLVGPIPDGLQLDHLCRNRACVRPEHLEPVTNRENWNRGNTPSAVHARKTHCHVGHPLSGDNLYVAPANGMRVCVTCRTARRRAWRQRRVEAGLVPT